MSDAGPEDMAARHARGLLALLAVGEHAPLGVADHPALAWRRSGLMAVTGRPGGPPLMCPAALAAAADGAMLALRALAPDPAALPPNGASLLGERARLLGLMRGGRVSANRSCRLLDARDGRVALSLARAEDWEAMPALLGSDTAGDWETVARDARALRVADLLERGILLGLPIAEDAVRIADSPFATLQRGAMRDPARAPPLVLDFSALWAGPLTASLLGAMGARVVKVESTRRLDGARRGHAGFYDLLNAGKQSVAIDFSDAGAMARLRALIARADIVIEASRPRALRRLGIDRAAAVDRGCVWVSITAHAEAERVGFGDDAGVAAGLASAMTDGWDEPLFAGDAIADPLTGLHAALAAWAAWRKGAGALLHLSLATSTAFAMRAGVARGAELAAWQALALADEAPIYRLRTAPRLARLPGADNRRMLGFARMA